MFSLGDQFHYIIRTSLAISYSDMLQILKDPNVEFTHCRDITRKETTLLRTMVGEYQPSSGSVTFPALSEDVRFWWSEIKEQIGYLPQKLPDWHGSLEDTLYIQAALRGMSPDESETQVQYLLSRLDLEEHITKRWSELSGGFQLRFALAQALVGKPR
jgi:ABC-2 type transport system ATP-binding protein